MSIHSDVHPPGEPVGAAGAEPGGPVVVGVGGRAARGRGVGVGAGLAARIAAYAEGVVAGMAPLDAVTVERLRVLLGPVPPAGRGGPAGG